MPRKSACVAYEIDASWNPKIVRPEWYVGNLGITPNGYGIGEAVALMLVVTD